MNYKRAKHCPLHLLALILSVWSTPGSAADSCSLPAPPPSAAAGENHGSFFFVYPRSVSPSFTGCQTMWDEFGRRVFVLRFAKGLLQEYSQTDYSDKVTSIDCKYKSGQPVATNPADCGAYEDLKTGLNIAADEEPSVPKEKDLRRTK